VYASPLLFTFAPVSLPRRRSPPEAQHSIRVGG
jgi:hypothetical protein